MTDEIRALLPKNKLDDENAKALVKLGYPAIAPVLPELFECIQDINWPIAHFIAPFLSTIGEAAFPEIRRILATSDGTWKYWVLHVVENMTNQTIMGLRDDLLRVVNNPTKDEVDDEVVKKAQEILARL